MTDSTRRGFTLIELAIVLVIVGLLAAGILVGRDLIKAAEVRAQIRQLDEYKLGMNTFMVKYQTMPGDMPPSQADAVGMVARSGGAGSGDGNGLITSCSNINQLSRGCEAVLFWSDLSAAGLIAGSFADGIDDYPIFATFEESTKYFPKVKMRGSYTFVIATPQAGDNSWFVSTQLTSQDDAYSYTYGAGGFTPQEVYAIDSKVDDGKPTSGTVRALREIAAAPELVYFGVPLTGADKCLLAQDQYNLSNTIGPLCQMNYRLK